MNNHKQATCVGEYVTSEEHEFVQSRMYQGNRGWEELYDTCGAHTHTHTHMHTYTCSGIGWNKQGCNIN